MSLYASVCLCMCLPAAMTLERGEKLEVMEEKAEDLENQSKRFQQRATQVKRHFFCQYIKLTILIVFILAVIATIIGVVVWQKTKSKDSSDDNNGGVAPVIVTPPVAGFSPSAPNIASIVAGASPGTLSVTVTNGASMGTTGAMFAYWSLIVKDNTPPNAQVNTPFYTSTPMTVTGLLSNHSYIVQARTWNNVGYGSDNSAFVVGTTN